MNAAVEAVSNFPWGLVLLAIAVAALVWVWRSGTLGKDNEDAIKARIRKLKGAAAAEYAKLAALKEPEETPPARDEDALLLHAKALFEAGKLTQVQYDAAVARIVAND